MNSGLKAGRRARPPRLAASLVCADMLHLADEVRRLEEGGADYIHFDVMDGTFVRRFGLHPEMLAAVRSVTRLPIDVHLMVTDPEPYIPVFAKAGATIITVHAEGNLHLHRTIALIGQAGAKAGLALNPATGFESLRYLVPELELVLLMGTDPGIVGVQLWNPVIGKIASLRQELGEAGPMIQVDGGVNYQSAPKMVASGADILVCGSATIFRRGEEIADNLGRLRSVISPASVA